MLNDRWQYDTFSTAIGKYKAVIVLAVAFYFVPFITKFPIGCIDYVEIGYARWNVSEYVSYIRVIKKNRRKSFRNWFSVNAYEKRKFFETPVHINEIYLIKETMRKMESELGVLGISGKVNEKETEIFI